MSVYRLTLPAALFVSDCRVTTGARPPAPGRTSVRDKERRRASFPSSVVVVVADGPPPSAAPSGRPRRVAPKCDGWPSGPLAP